MQRKNGFSPIVILVVVVLVAGLGYAGYMYRGEISQLVNSTPLTPTPSATPAVTNPGGTITIEGSLDCLPVKDTAGPQIMSCPVALKTKDGNFYAINFLNQNDRINTAGGRLLRITGTVTPPDPASPYNSLGTINAATIVVVERNSSPTSN